MQNIVALYKKSYDYLHQGEYQKGFDLFEHRWNQETIKTVEHPYQKLTKTPPWRSESLFGKSVLVQMEMGYGDCIQFYRFIPLLKVLGAKRVVVLQTKSLHYLLAQMECIDAITNDEHKGDSQTCDYWVGSMSLARIALNSPAYVRQLFPITKDKVVGSEGYLDAKPSNIERKVGVNWKASSTYLKGIKSATAEVMEQLCGTDCYSLNPEDDANFCVLPNDWKEDWAKTASHMKSLSAVVTVDTGTAHLAGALGVKCIVLLPDDEYVCWRWKNARWYDSIITLRKHEWGRVPELLKGV
jgi:hypothetical protein